MVSTENASIKSREILAAVLLSLAALGTVCFASEPLVPNVSQASARMQQPDADKLKDASTKPAVDRSGAKRVGKASFYANNFAGRKMADGKIMDPQANNAASRTLPLGTTAKVTNLQTGKSAVVVIQDRGPYVDGRIVDLSPAT